MERKYAIFNVYSKSIERMMDSDGLKHYLSYLLSNKYPLSRKFNIDNFIKFYTSIFYVSGKQTFSFFNFNLLRRETVHKIQKEEIIEIIREDDKFINFRILSPDEIFLFIKDNGFIQGSNVYFNYDSQDNLYKRHYFSSNNRNFKFRNPSKKHSSIKLHTFYKDIRFYKSLNERGRSEKDTWKNLTKNKHQWEHNLNRSHNIYKRSKKSIKNDFYKQFNNDEI